MSSSTTHLLDPGFDLTLRPMRYPQFYEMYRAAIRNTWSVEEIDFQIDLGHLQQRMTAADRHLIERLVAFFATGDSIVANNLVLNLYRHINAPEARMYLSRQLFEEALHVQFYLTLLDNYIPEPARRAQAFAAIENIPSIRAQGRFLPALDRLDRRRSTAHRQRWRPPPVPAQPDLLRRLHRRPVLLRRVRLRLLPAFARPAARARGRHRTGCSAMSRAHMAFAFEVIRTVREEQPELFDARMGGAGARDDRRGRRLRDAVRRGRALGRRRRPVGARHAPVPRVRRRPAPADARPARRRTAAAIRSRSWNCRTCRN